MRMTRTVVALATVGLGIVAAACSSSKATGPSAAKLAATFDSLYLVDSAANSNRSFFDLLALIAFDEGATPSSGSVTTAGGALSMEMVGLVVYNTATADSIVYVFGWTSDYSTEVITVLQGSLQGATVFQGTAFANADTASLVVSEGAGTGNCVFENEPFRAFGITSASPCTNQTVTETFALHFPATAGISASLTHMSLSPSKTVHAPRVLGAV